MALVLSKIARPLASVGVSILGITAKIGDAIVAFRASISSIEGFKNALLKLWEYFKIGAVAIKDFIQKVVEVAKSIKSFDDFKEVGGNMVSGSIEGIKNKASSVVEAILNVAKKLLAAVKDFFGIHSPSLLFMAIGGFIIAGLVAGLKDTSSISEAFGNIFSIVKKVLTGIITLVKTIGSILDPIISAIGKVFGSLFDSISNSISEGGLETVFDAINVGLLASLIPAIKKFINSFTSITDGIGGMFDGISGILDGVRGSLEAYQNAVNAEALMNIAKAVAILVLSLLALTLVDTEKLSTGLMAVGALMIELGTFLKMSGLTKLGKESGFGGAGTGILMLSLALLALSGVIAILGNMELSTIAVGTLALAGVLTVLSTSLQKLSGTTGLVKAGFSIQLIANALLTLTGVMFLMGSMDLLTIGKGLLGMAGCLLILIVTLNQIKGEKMIEAGVAITIIANALLILSASLAIMGNLNITTIIKGLGAMYVIITLVAAALKVVKTKNVLANSAAFVIMGTAMLILAGALAAMGALPIEVIGKGLLAMGGALAELAVALYFMTGTLPGSWALLVAAGALAVLTPVLITLGTFALVVATGLLVVAAAFLVLGAAGLVLTPLTPIILALSLAILALGVGMGSFGAGVLALATGLGMLVVIGAPAAAALKLVFTTLIDLIPLVLTRLGEGIIAIANVIADSASAIGNAVKVVVLALISVVNETIPPLFECVKLILDEVVDLLVEYTPILVEAVLQILIDSLQAIVDNIAKITELAVLCVAEFINGIADGIDDVVAAAVNLLVSFVGGIADNIGQVIDSGINLIISFIQGLADGINNNYRKFVNTAENLILSFCNAIGYCMGSLPSLGLKIIKAVLDGMKDGLSDFWDIGSDIIEGLVNGIKDGWESLKDGVTNLCSNIKDAFCDFFGINSPSKMFMEFGGYCVEGFAIGMKNTAKMAGDAAKSMAEQVVDSFGKPMLQINDSVLGEIDNELTIRPVLDLTDVKSGAKAIGGMLANKTLSVNMQPAAAVSASMANIQNGSDSSAVVSAIDKLRKDIADNPRTINNINGITYDDGSNIFDAIETIVRYVTIEGRS